MIVDDRRLLVRECAQGPRAVGEVFGRALLVFAWQSLTFVDRRSTIRVGADLLLYAMVERLRTVIVIDRGRAWSVPLAEFARGHVSQVGRALPIERFRFVEGVVRDLDGDKWMGLIRSADRPETEKAA